MTSTDDTPWPGLRPLDGERSDHRQLLELTRRDELHAINNMVAASRVSLLYAMSGNGKTSVLHAGIAPAFRRLGYVVIFTRPRPPWARTNPHDAFRGCLARQLPNELRQRFDLKMFAELESAVSDREELRRLAGRFRAFIDALPEDPELERDFEQRLRASGTSAYDAVCAATAMAPDLPFLIVCDQFEELFVHYANEPNLNEFIDDLGRIWSDTNLKVRLLFSMREDWVGSMIALRRTIPDMFRDYYRLQPVTARAAREILADPLKKSRYEFAPAAVRQVINDLAEAYDKLESRILGHVEADQATGSTKFVELPALLLVARKMWETRETSNARPFSLDHYRALGSSGFDSPAAHVLDTYLDDELDAKADVRDLQIDALYELTDHERHRCASSLTGLVREVKMHRPATLYKSDATVEDLRKALAALESRDLVRSTEVRGDVEYELAHDFLVRAVVKRWRELDHARAGRVGRLAAEQERKEQRLESLEKRNETTTVIMQLAPIVGLVGLLWSAISLTLTDLVALNPAQLHPGLLMFLSFAALGVAGVIARHRLSIIMSGIAIVAGVVGLIWLSDIEQAIAATTKRLSTDVARYVSPTMSPRSDIGQAIQRMQSTLTASSSSTGAAAAVFQLRNDLDVRLPQVEMAVQEITRQQLRGAWVGYFLLGIFVIIFNLFVRAEASLLSEENPWHRVLQIMWGELIDFATYLPATVPLLIVGWCSLAGVALRYYRMTLFGSEVALLAVLIIRFAISRKLQSSPGMRSAGFRVLPSRFVVREITLLGWTLVTMVAVIPWLLGALLIRSTGRTVPDWIAKTTLIDADDEVQAQTSPSSAHAAA